MAHRLNVIVSALAVLFRIVGAVGTVGIVACGDDSNAPCRVAADCASGLCLPSGLCAAPPTSDATDAEDTADATDFGGDLLGDTTSDTASTDTGDAPNPGDASDAADTDGGPIVCLPNRDGTITRSEVPIAPDLQATYLIATDVDFDSRGTPDADPRWDLDQTFTGDTKVLVTTLDPHDTWYGPTFPTATYATRLAQDSDLLGVFEAKSDGLFLLGVVSPEGGLFRTELTYDPPAKLMAYPLALNTTWASTSTITGLTSGVISYVTETYEGTVDNRGTLATPFADFDAFRVVLTLDRLVGAVPYSDVSHLFVTECFGTVATLRSPAYASGPEFTTASELRRLSP